MFDIFQNTLRPDSNLFFKKNDRNDARLGEKVSSQTEDYNSSQIVILGCPQDEGVARNKGRIGAALAPDAVRAQFYKLSDFGISSKIFDLGNTKIQPNLEETHKLHSKIVAQVLNNGKKLIVLGGGNDISYADGAAIAKVFGNQNWVAFNIDAHFDVRDETPRNSGTPYRQLLDEKLLNPARFYEMAWQPQVNSKIYHSYLLELGVKLTSLFELKSHAVNSPLQIGKVFTEILLLNQNESVFWGFDLDSVRASDAPGTSAPSPTGLTGEEFIELSIIAGGHANTKIIEFTELNPNFDVDNRTAKLIAAAMHGFCRA
jgi:formiminoglutamase